MSLRLNSAKTLEMSSANFTGSPLRIAACVVCLGAICFLQVVARQDRNFLRQQSSILAPKAGWLQMLGSGWRGSLSPKPFSWMKSAKPAPVASSVVKGTIKLDGVAPKSKRIDMSREPNCAKQYDQPPMTENVLADANNGLANVVVYVSAGAPEESAVGRHVTLNQRGCRYYPHVLALQARQELMVKNDDDVNHTVHFMTKTNIELNKIQAAKGPPFTITNDKPEFIRVKCELHPWMRGVIAVLKNPYFAVTDSDGSFSLPELPAGKYTISVWHESFGTESQQIQVGGGETKNLSFLFKSQGN